MPNTYKQIAVGGAQFETAPSSILDGTGSAVNQLVVSLSSASGGAAATPIFVNQVNIPVGTATIATGQASVTSSASAVVASRTGAAGTGRADVTIFNSGTNTVFLGASGVTSSTGIHLLAGANITLTTQSAIYAITASGSSTISYVETY